MDGLASSVGRLAPIALLVGTLAAAAACSEDPVGIDSLERARARATWQAQGLVRYTVEARISCFCPPAMNAWHELTVTNDSIVAIRALDPVFENDPARASWFASVDEVYRRMDLWGVGQRGFSVSARFDPATGLPTRVALNTPPTIADGDAVYEFRALKPGLAGQ